VLWVRARFPRLVFVTTSELMQLKGAGWSREVFPAYWSGLFRAMRGLVLPPLCNEGSLTWHHVAQVWHDRVVLRNHNAEVAEVTLPRHSDLYCSSGENPGSSCRNAREEKTSDAREDLVFVREVDMGRTRVNMMLLDAVGLPSQAQPWSSVPELCMSSVRLAQGRAEGEPTPKWSVT
jgi:hypothetical protein